MTDLNEIYKSVLEADRAAVVICDLEHIIVYMNPAAIKNYEKWGGKALLGKNLLDCHNEKSRIMIKKVLDWFRASKENNLVYTSYNEKENKDVYMVALRNEAEDLVAYYEKHEYRNRETMKMYDMGVTAYNKATELINSGYVKSADEEMREAQEWTQKAERLEEQYRDELTAAGDDEEKKNKIIRQIANEVGMPPRLAAMGMMSRPIVSQLHQYFSHVKMYEPDPAHTSADLWTCNLCGTENDGIFCKGCGAKRP